MRIAKLNMAGWVALGFLVLIAAGCARPDWIEQTLVTVDVTGVWRGTVRAETNRNMMELALQQSGPKVTGQSRFSGYPQFDGLIEGTVSGDTLRFRDSRGGVVGELQVNGDEMTGRGTGPSFGGSGPVTFSLRRQP